LKITAEMKVIKQNITAAAGIISILLVFAWVFSFFQEGSQVAFAEFCLYLTYGLVGLLTVACLALAIAHLASNRDALIKTVIFYGIVTVVFIIAYVTANDDVTTVKAGLYTASSLKFVGSLVGMTWGVLIIAGLSALMAEVLKIFKNG
jgi:hypothetical protein